MGANRKKEDREVDLIETARLHLKGHTLTDIAQRLSSSRDYSVSHVTIYRDLETIFDRWKEAQKEHYANFIMQSIEEIRLLKKTAWESFEASKTEKDKSGDPRFLAIVDKQLEKEAKLLGFYKIELTISDTQIIIKPPEPEGIEAWLPEGEEDFTKFEEIE